MRNRRDDEERSYPARIRTVLITGHLFAVWHHSYPSHFLAYPKSALSRAGFKQLVFQ
tara:strand:- start:187 stop:357 length:171 start_codon:yes stop_codon:yes gene_type:complete